MSPKMTSFLIVAPAMTVLDQVTKYLVRARIPLGKRVDLIPDFLALWHRDNPGAAFGLLRNFEYRILVFVAVTLVAFLFIGYYLRGLAPKERWMAAALGFITSGAAGNLIDRVLFHKVTDFVDVYAGFSTGLKTWLVDHVGTYHYNTFNVADAGIVIGVAMFLIYVVFLEKRSK